MPPRTDLLPLQLEGAAFLSDRNAALLADEPGVGKTAQAVVAADSRFAANVLVVTTASARQNWIGEFRMWSFLPRKAQALFGTKAKVDASANLVVAAWSIVHNPAILAQLLARRWDVLILDESHYAKGRETQRTTAVFGGFNEDGTRRALHALVDAAEACWCLTGTPMPNSPADLYPMLRALFPEALAHVQGRYDRYEDRYCVVTMMRGRPVKVIVRGKNEPELREIVRPLMLRRPATDLPPFTTSLFYLDCPKAADELAELEAAIDREALLAAAAAGRPIRDDDFPGLAELRRRQGEIKARASAERLAEELESGELDKVIVFRWHKATGAIIRDALSKFGLVTIDGATPGPQRERAVQAFQNSPAVRVFDGQIVAAGEAITLTAANQVFFVETSIVPKDMEQAPRRSYRRGQTRPVLCRFATLPGSLDEQLTAILARKVATIQQVIDQP